MNSNPHNPKIALSDPDDSAGDATLRLISSLPAPLGLEDRVHTALQGGSQRRNRVLSWPKRLNPQNGWMRSAAAAAIVFVVVGGGWGVYTRVGHYQPGKVIPMPMRMPATGALSSAGAVRTPHTLPGPVVIHSPAAPAAQMKKNGKLVTALQPTGPAGGTASALKSVTQSGASK